MASKEQVAKVLAVAMLGYPSLKAQPADELARLIEYYAAKLDDFPAEIIAAAVDVCGGEWFPSAHKIREACARLSAGQLAKTPALEAWEAVMIAVRKYGAYCGYTNQTEAGMTPRSGMPGAINDPIAQAVVDALGWNTLCQGDSVASERARFVEMYEQKRESVVEFLRLTPAARDINQRQIEARMSELTKRLTSPTVRP